MTIGPWDFNFVDVIVLIVVLISALMAMSRGLKRELISIFGLIVGAIVTLIVWGRFRMAAHDFIQPTELADLVLGAGTFFLTYLIVSMFLAGILGGEKGATSGLDRLLGALFGAARGLVVAALIVMLDTANFREGKDLSKLGEYFETNPQEIPPELIEEWNNIEDILNRPAPELDEKYQNSVLYPLLEKIGVGIRHIPFSQLKSLANRLKDGEDVDLEDIKRALGL